MKRFFLALLLLVGSQVCVAASTAETNEVLFQGEAGEVRTAAESLGGPIAIYEHIRNNYEFTPYHGARASSLTTYYAKRGNDVDIASLAIAMYRSVGIPARYVEGLIEVKSSDVMAWLGVESQTLAETLMLQQGILPEDPALTDGYPVYDEVQDTYTFQHTWIEVLLPDANYRGLALNEAQTCIEAGNGCTWVALDPSFKKLAFNSNPISFFMDDIVDSDAFFQSLYDADLNGDPVYQNKNPLEIYEDKVLNYLEINHPGASIVDVIDNGHIVEDHSGLLPLSMPYRISSIKRKFDSIASRDSALPAGEFRFSKETHISLVYSDTGTTIINDLALPVSDIADARLVVTFENCAPGYCDVQVRKNGQIIHSVPFSEPNMDLYDLVKLSISSDPASPLYEPVSATYPTTYVGGMYAVASGGYASSWPLVHRAIEKLLGYHDQYPTAVAPDNSVYLDLNENGEIDSGELLKENPEALEAISGGFLDVAVKMYFAKFYDAHRRLEGLHKVNMPISAFIGVTSTKLDVNYINGSAFLVNPKGLLIDLKGIAFNGTWLRDQENVFYNDHFELLANVSSSLEHEIWQELTGFDAISTVRGFQWIREAGAPLIESSPGSTADLDKADCYRVSSALVDILSSIGNPDHPDFSADETFTQFPLRFHTKYTNGTYTGQLYTFTWQDLHDAFFDAYQADADGTPKINIKDMVRFVSNNGISMSSGITYLPQCDGTSMAGTFDNFQSSLFEKAKQFASGGTIPSRENYSFGSIGENLVAPAYFSGSISHELREAYSSASQGVTYKAVTPVVANSIDGNSYSVYMKQQMISELPDGTPIGGNPVIVSIQMGLADGTLTTSAGGGLVLFPETYDWFGVSSGCSMSDIFCGFSFSDYLDEGLFGETLSLADTHNNLLITPTTLDPVNTVTGNMFHDAADIEIKGRGLNYTFTRTYNSKASLGDANWAYPFSEGWTHSYNARLIDSDGIKYIDERGASYEYDLIGGKALLGVQDIQAIAFSAETSGSSFLEIVGDMNGDGIADAVYAHAGYDSSIAANVHELNLIAGTGGGLYQAPALIESRSVSGYGATNIIPYGDVNADGFADVLWVTSGQATLYLGSAGGPVAASASLPDGEYSYAGDINGDGYKDVASYQDTQGLFIYYGSATGFDVASAQQIMPTLSSHASYLDKVRTAMDLNADGFEDIIVNFNEGVGGEARARVYLGSATGLSSAPATSQVFANGATEFPAHAFVLGDVNGDSLPDVGLRFYDEAMPGFEVYFNSASGFDLGSGAHVEHAGNSMGFYPLGDQNGDGFSEFAILRTVDESTFYSVYSGIASGIEPGPVWEFEVEGTYADLLTGSAFSYPVYLSGEAQDILLLTATEMRTVSFDGAVLGDVTGEAVCEREIVRDWQGQGGYMLPFCNGNRYVFSPLMSQNGEQSARLESIEDPYGNVITLSYDAQGRLELVSDNSGIAGRTGLDLSYGDSGAAAGKLESVSDWTGRTWTYEYDAQGRLSAVVPPAGQDFKVTYGYVDETHLLYTITKPEDRDGAKNEVAFEYYENGRAYRYVNGVGDPEVVDYDIFSTSSRITHPGGGVTVHDYNASGMMEKVVNPDGGVIRYKNTDDNRRYSKKNALGYETAYSYRADRSISSGPSDTEGLVTRERDPLGHTRDFDYGIYNQITRQVDKRGNERSYIYYDENDAATGKIKGKLHEVRATINGEANVLLQSFTYYPHGGVKQKIDYIDQVDSTRQRVTTFTYINNGLNVESISVSGATDAANYGSDAVTSTVSFTYDSLGRVKTKTQARRTSAVDSTMLDLTTTYEYDSFGRVVRETDPAGNITESIYDKNGKLYQLVIHHKHPDGSLTSHTQVTNYYDAYDRLVRSVDIESGETHYKYGPTVYEGKSDLLAVTDANGNTVRHEYDAMHRRTATIDGNGHRTEFRYDSAGNLVKVINPVGQAVSYQYDPLGRQTLEITHTGKASERRYDAAGNVTHILDANAYADPAARNSEGASVYREYDEFNRVVREVNAENGETLYGYDLVGNLISLTDAEGQVTQFVYDDMGLLREEIDPIIESPEDLTVRYTYDEMGNRLTAADRKGQTKRFTYDILNRLTRTEYLADGTQEVRIYDAYGNLESLSNEDVTYTYTYDDKHRVTSRTDSRLGLSLSWTYDPVGNIRTKTDYQGGVTVHQYDEGNRLVATANEKHLHARYAYDGSGRLVSRALSNGSRTIYSYNTDGQLESMLNLAANGQIVGQQAFEYDAVGNIRTIDDGEEIVYYTYDSLYRLVVADHPGSANDISYTYDLVGNRETFTKGGSVVHYKYANGNRLVGQYRDAEYSDPIKTYEYDENGNRTAVIDGDGVSILQSLFFNQRGFPESAEAVSGTSEFDFDPNGYRIRRNSDGKSSNYLLDGEHVDAIYSDEGNLLVNYYRGKVVDEIVAGYSYTGEGYDAFSVHNNQVQSVAALTDHNGNIISSYEYSPFGRILSSQDAGFAGGFSYTGREMDASLGLYYYRARFYDPEVGRFISEDPIGFLGGINRYAYVSNNPLLKIDPYGNIEWDIAAEVLVDHWNSGEMLANATRGARAGASLLTGTAELALAYGSGGLLAPVVGTHGVSNITDAIGQYAEIIDGRSRNMNFVRNGYESLSRLSFGDERYGTAAYHLSSLTFAGAGAFSTVRVSGTSNVYLGGSSIPLSLERSREAFAITQASPLAISGELAGTAFTSYDLYQSLDSGLEAEGYFDYPGAGTFPMEGIVYEPIKW